MKDGFVKIAAATPKITVADCDKNAYEIISQIKKAENEAVKLIVFPELCITGYTCGDLFLQRTLLRAAENSLINIMNETADSDIVSVIGLPFTYNSKLYNCAAVITGGKLLGLVPKKNIPNYSEFYEKRHFSPAPNGTETVKFQNFECSFGTDIIFSCTEMPEFTFAVEICEDLWVASSPSARHAVAGAKIICNLSASDETVSKRDYRRNLVSMQSAKLLCTYIYSDAGDGESSTDMVFAGHNIVAENGTVLAEATPFENGISVTETDVLKLDAERRRISDFSEFPPNGYTTVHFNSEFTETALTRKIEKTPFIPSNENLRNERCRDIITMQACGLKKRIEHSHAKAAVIGISGGLDSTLALLVAVRAADMLERPRSDIYAITMPCFGTTERTKSNAVKLCEELGVTIECIDIKESVEVHLKAIGHDISDHSVTYENAQARERTKVLMDMANKTGGIVIGTGDLSELALGWATYNGDHMSMYGVNSSIPKTLVKYLVRYYADNSENENLKSVLLDILATPVSPELLPAEENGSIAQKTEDIVGPYILHDFFLYYGIRWTFPPKKVYRLARYAFEGDFTDETIKKWIKTFYRRFFSQQFKRSCLPDGPKVGSVTLSPRGDFRMPSDASSALWMKEIENL